MVLIVLNTATTTRPDPASSVRSEHKAQQEDEFVNILYSEFMINQDFCTTSRIFIKEVKGIKSAILEYF